MFLYNQFFLMLEICRTTIEILPLDLTDISQELLDQATEQDPTFILVQGNLGIFRKSLLKLYLRTSMRLAELSELPSHEAIRGTSLLLLANPGHSTALNARIRLVESGALSLSYELRWVSLLLLSSKEASKQSILWAYRRRLLVGLAEVFSPRLSSLAAEVSLVLNVCGMYPRNYYAWNHLYLCLEPCILSVDLPEIQSLVEQLDRLKDWVQTHVSDYSAAHHYCCLTAKAQTTKFASSYGIHTLKGIKEHSLSLVRSFPSHES
jgi:protein prenyltransferase alpha subunit repeat containing protein 1